MNQDILVVSLLFNYFLVWVGYILVFRSFRIIKESRGSSKEDCAKSEEVRG